MEILISLLDFMRNKSAQSTLPKKRYVREIGHGSSEADCGSMVKLRQPVAVILYTHLR